MKHQKNMCIIILAVLLNSCDAQVDPNKKKQVERFGSEKSALNDFRFRIDSNGTTIKTRFRLGKGLERLEYSNNSFQNYLCNLQLKPHGSKVHYYNGETKQATGVYCAVVDLPIGKKDLHQCADAVMHVKARYHFERKEYDKIGFHFVNGFYCDYSHWENGYRLSSSKTSWVKKTTADNSDQNFWSYLETVFMFAGTASLTHELTPVKLHEMQVGDVFILGGSPGHAVIVLDMAIDVKSQEKFFMLGQSYMPAQELQVLVNNKNEKISPWVSINSVTEIVSTPEWTFYPEDLKRF